MKIICYSLFLIFSFSIAAYSQTLEEAKMWYKQKKFSLAKPVFETELQAKPTDPSLNLWYGVCLYETGGEIDSVMPFLKTADQRSIPDASLYLGDIYTKQYQLNQALDEYDKYARLKKRDKDAANIASERKAKVEDFVRLVKRTEDVQIIDSIVVDKDKFLNAYKLTPSSGKLATFNELFDTNEKVDATAYLNEKGTKVYYSQMDKDGFFKLYSMEKLLEQFGNERQVAPDNFGMKGDENYPFVQTDGVTLYFAAKDEDSMGGYDLFVTRYNLDNDSYLRPERLNMPFNSIYNDYLLVMDEEKGVGWFASDRFQPKGKVCVYTFIPNEQVKTLENESLDSLAMRARIFSIKDSWKAGVNYSKLVTLARKQVIVKQAKEPDFAFVINDNSIYYQLSDFKSANARALFSQLTNLNKILAEKKLELDEKRQNYSKANKGIRMQMTQGILSVEKEVEILEEKQAELTIQIRNLENSAIR